MFRRPSMIAAAFLVLAAGPVRAEDAAEGWKWLATTNEIETHGAIWNDRIGDGKDRWKSGGLTQSVILPEHVFSDQPWFEGRASALELNGRAVVMTPDNTADAKANPNDRPYAQYAGVGLYLRSIARPRPLGPGLALQNEVRVGIEAGWQGDPLPLFDVQNGIHAMTGLAKTSANPTNTIDSEFLVNLEGRHTWRLHWDGPQRDVELTPFVQGSLGMRETSLRVGADLIVGDALEGRTWGNDLATGALLAGASMPRKGFHWTFFTGADLGYVASDAFLDGGFAANGPSVPRERLVPRARAGVLLEYDKLGVGYSLNWLGKEFRGQPGGQVIGALQIKYRF